MHSHKFQNSKNSSREKDQRNNFETKITKITMTTRNSRTTSALTIQTTKFPIGFTMTRTSSKHKAETPATCTVALPSKELEAALVVENRGTSSSLREPISADGKRNYVSGSVRKRRSTQNGTRLKRKSGHPSIRKTDATW